MKKFSALAAALTAAFASPAFATSTASASLGDFGVTLIDLNPSDGIAPSISWGSDSNHYVSGYTNSNVFNNDSFWKHGGFPDSSVSGSANSAYSQAAASSSPGAGGQVAGAAFYAGGSAQGGPNILTSSSEFSAQAYSSFTSFTLSANTLAVFRFDGSVSAQTTVGSTANAQTESAYAYASMSVSGNTTNFDGYQTFFDSMSASAAYTYQGHWDPVTGWQQTYTPQVSSTQRPLLATFSNVTSGNLTGVLEAQVYAQGYSSIPSVPEPETYAMMLSGLGLIGGIVRRKRRIVAG